MATRGAANGAQAGGAMNKKILASVREATGASEEDIQAMLAECNGDVNEAVTRLLDNPFEQVQSKRDRQKQTKRPEAGPPRGGSRGGDIPGSAGYGTVREVRRGGGFTGERGGRGGGRGGSRDRPQQDRKPAPSGNRPGGAPPTGRPSSSSTAPQTVTVPRPTPAPAAPTGPQVGNPPPIRPSASGTAAKSFTDILRNDPAPSPAPAPAPAPASPVAAPSPPSPPPETEPPAPAPSAPQSSTLTFAEKLAAANISASQAPVQPPPKAEPAPIQSAIQPPASYQPPQVSAEPSSAEVSSSTWGPPSAQSPNSLQNSGLAGLLSGKSAEEDKSPLDVSSAADSLGLQFGQFGMGGTGMGDFGAGFGAGFGDELGAADETVPAPAKSQQDPPDASNDAPVSYQPAPAYSYGQQPSAMSSLSQPPKASDAATAQPAASQFPSPYYAQPGYPHVAPQPPPPAPQGTPYTHYSTTDHKVQHQPGQGLDYHYGQQQGRSDEYPATSAPAPPKYGVQGGHRSDGFGSHEPPSSSAAAASGAQAAPLQPVPPQQQQQMPAFPSPAMPPGMTPQYGYLHQYPYMHNPNMYMYPNAYPHYGGAAAYPPQAGNTSFPPSVGSSTYQTQMPAGPKYSYPYAQTSQTPLSSGLAPGGYSYSSPSGVYSGDDPSSVSGYGKDTKDSIYGSASIQQQVAPQMARDSPYAYSMPGQGYQQQGYSAGAQGQYNTSAYAQYMQQAQQYAMPPNMGGQGGLQGSGQGQSGGYKLQ